MICGKVAFKIDKIASSLSSHSPEELISKSFDYVLAKGKTPAKFLEQLKHAPVRTNVVTPLHWLESRWQNSQRVISVRMPSKICVNFIAMSDHITPTGYINNYINIVVACTLEFQKKIYQTSHPLVDPGFDARGW